MHLFKSGYHWKVLLLSVSVTCSDVSYMTTLPYLFLALFIMQWQILLDDSGPCNMQCSYSSEDNVLSLVFLACSL